MIRGASSAPSLPAPRALGAAWLLAILAVLPGMAPTRAQAQVPAHGSAVIAACIRDPRCHRIFAAAHRAGGFGHPGNSRAGVAANVGAGVPVVEVDLRGSRDGELFVIHDGPLERATDARGRIETLPAVTVARARLANGETVPRFAEVYALTRGRAVLNVDFKTPPEVILQVAAWIQEHGSFDDILFFVNTGEEMVAAAEAKRRFPAMMVMVRLLDTRVTVESTRAVFGRLPEIFHTDRVSLEAVARLQALGVKVYMNAVPVERYPQPFRYFALRSLLGTRPDLVLTEDPLGLMRKVASLR